MKRIFPTIALLVQLSLLSSLTLTQTACPGEKVSRSKALSYAEEAVAIARDILPVFSGLGKNTAPANELINTGDQLVQAFKENRDAEALTLTASFITKLGTLTGMADGVQDSGKQTLILALIAGGRIAMRHLTDFLQPAEDSGMVNASAPGKRNAAATIRAFRDEPQWRCRSSQTGRFEKMEYCRAHPDVSQVERVRRQSHHSAQISTRNPQHVTQDSVVAITECKIVRPAPRDAAPNTTTLDCGKDAAGEDLVLEIPFTIATFPKGDVFRLELFSNGEQRFDPDNQPRDSVVWLAQPCLKPRPGKYERRALNALPCNPDLQPQ